MAYLLDTSIVSDMMRNASGAVARHIESVGPANILLSALVVAEIEYGLLKLPSKRLRRRADQLISTVEIVDFGREAATAYAEIRHLLSRSGRPIGGMDMLIAAQALAGGHVVVTANEREFGRVPGLRVENWLR